MQRSLKGKAEKFLCETEEKEPQGRSQSCGHFKIMKQKSYLNVKN